MSEDLDRRVSTGFTTRSDERWVIGYDRARETFFATVDRPQPTPGQRRELQGWVDHYNSDAGAGPGMTYAEHVEHLGVARRVDHIAGAQPRDVTTAAELITRLTPHVQLDYYVRDHFLPVVEATKNEREAQSRMAPAAPAERRPDASNATTAAASASSPAEAVTAYQPRHTRDPQSPAALASADYPVRLNTGPAPSDADRQTAPDLSRPVHQVATVRTAQQVRT